ncbi:hypothetical protein CSUI_007209, partial [Cystoisospora suis]
MWPLEQQMIQTAISVWTLIGRVIVLTKTPRKK